MSDSPRAWTTALIVPAPAAPVPTLEITSWLAATCQKYTTTAAKPVNHESTQSLQETDSLGRTTNASSQRAAVSIASNAANLASPVLSSLHAATALVARTARYSSAFRGITAANADATEASPKMVNPVGTTVGDTIRASDTVAVNLYPIYDWHNVGGFHPSVHL